MHVIPQIIAFLGDSELDIRMAGADALAKLSEQRKISKIFVPNVADVLVAEFRESISPAIPEIIPLLSHSDLNVRRVAADALSKLSEQGKVYIFCPECC